MNEYEAIVMLHADSSKEVRTAALERAREVITAGKGTWVADDDWGRRELAYEIDHQTHAHYVFATFDCDPATLDEFLRVLRITEGVVRVMATARVDAADVEKTAAVEIKPRGRGRDRDRD